MTDDTYNDPLAHDAPVRWLTGQLHQGTTLADRVRAMRWRRKRPATTVVVDATPVAAPVEIEQKDEHDNDQQHDTPA